MTLLPFSAAYAVVSLSTPGLARIVSPRTIIIAGSILTILALWWIAQTVSHDMTVWTLMPHMIVLGIGMGAIMAQITTVTMSRVAPEESGEASGLSETLKEIIGQGFAVALAGSVLFGAVYASMTDSYEQIEGVELSQQEELDIIVELEDTFQEISEIEEREWVAALPENTRTAYADIVREAASAGLRQALYVMMVCMGLGLVCSLFLPGGRSGEEGDKAADTPETS